MGYRPSAWTACCSGPTACPARRGTNGTDSRIHPGEPKAGRSELSSLLVRLQKRSTSRVLLVDEHDRLLLLCGRDPRSPGARWWFTVGGGVEAGEGFVAAAVREVREETALSLRADRLGPVVWTRQAIFSVDGRGFDQYEEYRLARVTVDEASLIRIDAGEARYGWRWWSVQELAATRETVRPRKMAVLLPKVLSGPPQPAPRDLGTSTRTPTRSSWGSAALPGTTFRTLLRNAYDEQGVSGVAAGSQRGRGEERHPG
jgi:8-oxo-dGTP pyrophosphatase MutT (NUDIX family)